MSILPFDRMADVLDQARQTIRANVAVSTPWPAGARPQRTGIEHSHTAQGELVAAPELRKRNAKLRYDDGIEYSIVEAEKHEYLPHVELRLKRILPG